ncbi:pyrroline-5-carboxylate reductase [Lactobacillus sp. CC-MHH1034]|uniref:pyrroline-5-carboxylate reductase n=1 Tax=Agrilactobacillus fermenti TaxID=2586909 RepID=UPI001E3DEAF3|nr:pyrroline-5-carboxylate reductase [Agrilactobacillus fermenti]MCD2255099.1 pyrroline-5-carboxylate reductase [Agrilactobacillus fermenti]
MKIGFIGVGHMASAMIQGLLRAGYSERDIVVHSAHQAHYEAFAQANGVIAAKDNLSLAQTADLIILAVEPSLYQSILTEIKPAITTKKIIASVLTGITVAQLQTALGVDMVPIVRLMPNVNVAINQGMTAMQGNTASLPEARATIRGVFEKLGAVMILPEDKFSVFVALAGSSPAFIYLFIDSLARAGVKYGLSKAQATEIAAQATLGSAQMVLDADQSPFDLIDQVSSPGGTTIAGLLAMEEHGLITSVIKGVDATIAKDEQGS